MPSPGAAFALKSLPGFLIPVLGLKAFFFTLRNNHDVAIPSAVTCLAYIAVNPLLFFLRVVLTSWRHKRDAARMGAVQVPVLRGRASGNYDVVKHLAYKWDNGYVAEPFWPIIEKLGNIFCIRFIWSNQLFTTEPSHIKQILSTEFNNFEKGTAFTAAARSVLGVGVFNSDGEMWKFHRNMTRPFFTRERISHFDIFSRHADTALSLAAQRFHEGYGVDMQDLFARFTLDSATDFLTGRCLNSLREELPFPRGSDDKARGHDDASSKGVAASFSKAFLAAQFYMEKRTRRGEMWPLWEMKDDATRESMTVVEQFLNPIINDILHEKGKSGIHNPALRRNDEEEEVLDEEETLVDHLVKHTNDLTIIKDETLNILLAGRDTIAATLTFATYALAMYSDVLQRLRTEIMDYVGPSRRPTYDDIRDMKYLRAFINEVLRLYPPVPYNIRQSIKSTVFPNSTPGGKPWYVPPRTNITYSVFMMHRRADLWGPDAMEFDPDRFLDDRAQKYLTPNPFIFLPFNAGPRICLGQQFAYNEISFMLIRLLQTFGAIQLDEEAQPIETRPPAEWKNVPGRQSKERFFPKVHLTMYTYGGLWVRMNEAKEKA